jgi:hypothetical protein
VTGQHQTGEVRKFHEDLLGESASKNEFNGDNPPAGFFASRVLSFFVVWDVAACGDFLSFETILVRMVTSLS